jgi:CDP-diacylglycerol--glycerol-3-phosphate 3-phosphatidyltransferase
MLNILLGFLISYVKARAESLDIECNGGIAERTERLIITLLTIGLSGIGIPNSLTLGMWILFLLSLITVVQRINIVYRATK